MSGGGFQSEGLTMPELVRARPVTRTVGEVGRKLLEHGWTFRVYMQHGVCCASAEHPGEILMEAEGSGPADALARVIALVGG